MSWEQTLLKHCNQTKKAGIAAAIWNDARLYCQTSDSLPSSMESLPNTIVLHLEHVDHVDDNGWVFDRMEDYDFEETGLRANMVFSIDFVNEITFPFVCLVAKVQLKILQST